LQYNNSCSNMDSFLGEDKQLRNNIPSNESESEQQQASRIQNKFLRSIACRCKYA
jgi:hypothetical protein